MVGKGRQAQCVRLGRVLPHFRPAHSRWLLWQGHRALSRAAPFGQIRRRSTRLSSRLPPTVVGRYCGGGRGAGSRGECCTLQGCAATESTVSEIPCTLYTSGSAIGGARHWTLRSCVDVFAVRGSYNCTYAHTLLTRSTRRGTRVERSRRGTHERETLSRDERDDRRGGGETTTQKKASQILFIVLKNAACATFHTFSTASGSHAQRSFGTKLSRSS